MVGLEIKLDEERMIEEGISLKMMWDDIDFELARHRFLRADIGTSGVFYFSPYVNSLSSAVSAAGMVRCRVFRFERFCIRCKGYLMDKDKNKTDSVDIRKRLGFMNFD